MINNPIEGNLPLEYSYQIEVTQHPSFYKVRAHNNVFDFLNNIQRHSTSRELDNCEFTIFVNSEGELKLDDKEEVITQLQANISQLKNTNDSIDLKLIKTMEEYIESNNSLEYDLLKAVINQ